MAPVEGRLSAVPLTLEPSSVIHLYHKRPGETAPRVLAEVHGPQVWSMMLAVDRGLRIKTQFDQAVDGIFESGWGPRIRT